jgi:NDP-4-keto-2,6-dideoxyhexose 3-C-methyltransferase
VYNKIDRCRICGNTNLACVLDLGEQMLTGVFPRTKSATITTGPLRLMKCTGDTNECGLLQLEHSYDLGEMYGDNYGYRSGLNASMVEHLHKIVNVILSNVDLSKGDLVVDIGSNDSTSLQAYPVNGPTLVGIDPTGIKFSNYYPSHVQLIPDFFSSDLLKKSFANKKAKVITSLSMFYDLEDPISFMEEIYKVLADDGVWLFEQSYMPSMLNMNSYDTVCHEHLEYYTLRQIKWMADRVGFNIIDVEFNDINGGSFLVTVAKCKKGIITIPLVEKILEDEYSNGYGTLKPYNEFALRVAKTKDNLLEFIHTARDEGKSIAALGASTKGNVLLQYCGLTESDIQRIGEVNIEKYGCFTPGTWIPIVPEDNILGGRFDYLIVLPWHLRSFFLNNVRLKSESLVFPLPSIEIIKAK